jgi:putative PIN family toxin of toxin-antitoxin system
MTRERRGRSRPTRPTASRSRKSGQFARPGAVAPREARRRRPERPRLGVRRQSRRRAGQLVAAWRKHRFVMIVSPQLLAELGEVLARPKLQRWTGSDRGTAYVAAFAAQGEPREDPEDDAGGHVRAADDDYLVALAQTAKVDAIVSLDRDLLDAQLDRIAVVDPVRPQKSLTRVWITARRGRRELREGPQAGRRPPAPRAGCGAALPLAPMGCGVQRAGRCRPPAHRRRSASDARLPGPRRRPHPSGCAARG